MWSAIHMLRAGEESEVVLGLERLARAYWRPLYFFLRTRGEDHESACDLVQGFFEYLLTGDVLRRAHPGHGRFRNFLLVVFRRWLSDERRKGKAKKRGAGATHLPFDELEAASVHLPEAADESPEEGFDRKWGLALVQRALERLAEEWSARAPLFEALKRGLDGTGGTEPYAVIGRRLWMSEGAVKTAAYELRRAFAVLVRGEVRATVATEEEVEDELRYLVRLLER